MNTLDFSKKSFVLVTGASRGIGRQIAVSVSKLLRRESVVVLIARSEAGLTKTSSLIKILNKAVIVKTYTLDLSNPVMADYQKIMAENEVDVDNAVIFHNAGSLGTLDKVTTMTSCEDWHSHFNLNVISMSLLNAAFFSVMRPRSAHLFVINISSLCGSQPFKSMGMYCTGKAARNLFFKVMAAEESDAVVLNYSPGPVDTDMIMEVIDNVNDGEIKSMFVGLKRDKTVLSADVTVEKMLEILKGGDFKSGDLIDYYDRI